MGITRQSDTLVNAADHFYRRRRRRRRNYVHVVSKNQRMEYDEMVLEPDSRSTRYTTHDLLSPVIF